MIVAGMATVGLLHPGEMGAALGQVLRDRGHEVLWASSGRSEATSKRAAAAGLSDVLSVETLVERSEVILSVCPPHAALDVARTTIGSTGLLVDANAIAPGLFPTALTAPVANDPAKWELHAKRTFIGRNGELDDLAGTAVYLASHASDYVTGQIIFVDGGYSAG